MLAPTKPHPPPTHNTRYSMNRPTPNLGWIPEVQGLRTLALALVAIYHIWFGKVSGGVDVFLVVSAFLLVRSFTARAERGEPTKPAAFILRRFALLLPLTALTVVTTILACYLILPTSLTASNVYQGLASLTYWENFWLQDAEVEYLAGGADSPFQHFWSLSVQGQIFIIWPLVLAVCIWFARRIRIPVRPLLTGLFAVLTIAGFIYATAAVSANAQHAYFSLPARVWEFAAGSVLALIQPYLRIPSAVRIPLGWIGVVALIACGAVLPANAEFPSWPALWPVGAAVLVILAAGEESPYSARAFLCHPWMQQAARYTYALYLTHWPVLVFVRWLWPMGEVTPVAGAGVLLFSVALAIIFTELVDRPVKQFVGSRSADQRPSPKKAEPRSKRNIITGTVSARSAIALGLVLVLSGGFVLAAVGNYRARASEAWTTADAMPIERLGANNPNAIQLGDQDVLPDQVVVRNDLTRLGECDDETLQNAPDLLSRTCMSNRAQLSAPPERTIAIVGNSQTQQAASLLLPAAQRAGWELRAFVYFSCQFGSYGRLPHKATECDAFWEEAREYLLREQPDAVLLQITRSDPNGAEPELPGIWDFIDELEDAGIDVIAMRDLPRMSFNPFGCVERTEFENPACSSMTQLAAPRPDLARTASEHGASYLDVNDMICPEGECRPVRGGVYVFMDASHQTATYMRTVAPTADRRIRESLEWWPVAA